jgi:hypothetical protein
LTTRRSFLTGAAAVAALAQRPAKLWSQVSTGTSELTLSVDMKKPGATMPRDFTGLSYESAQLGHPDVFSAETTSLIGLFQRLGPQGVLRIGGNTGEYTTWSSDDADAAKNMTPHAMGPDAGTAAKTASIITPLAIRNLNDFILKVRGWKIIYGLNLWHGTPENAAAEATYVAKILGPRLICFQIGNEPDMDHDVGSKDRWTFEHYWERWQIFQAAVKHAVPGARFAGPDIAKEYDWIAKMAEKRPDIEFLTGHYYAEGPPADPKMTLEFLLKRGRDPASGEIQIVQAATKALGKPFRMSEGNSCFHGGKPLVSDTLASALWSGDYMLQLAQAGYIGVNLHGGGNGLYTPIAGDTPQGFTARPVYYGMLLAEHFAGSTFVEATLSQQADTQNVTAFAASNPAHGWKLAIFNKAAAATTVNMNGLGGSTSGSVQWLQAPAIDSHDGVTLGGSAVGPSGAFTPKTQATMKISHGIGTLQIPAYTAAYIEG